MTVTALPFPSYADRPLRVLRADLSSRIADLNAVRDALRARGLTVLSQDLINRGQRPLLRLKAGDAWLRQVAECIRTVDAANAVATWRGVDLQYPLL